MIKDILNNWLRRPNRGAYVICVRADGCMAEKKTLMWVGQIIRFSDSERAAVEVLQWYAPGGALPCWGTEVKAVIWDDGTFQKITPNLYFYTT